MAVTGGSKMPSSKISPDGTFARADLHAGVSPSEGAGTSIFDPALCELVYTWFTGGGFKVLDPFAGGSVRGLVASILGRYYTGIELRAEQVAANVEQLPIIANQECKPQWICGDSLVEVPKLAEEYDFVFSCPPYGDLEIYSELKEDISTLAWPEFIQTYRQIIERSIAKLKQDRFACFVVGDYRDVAGYYRNFVGETVTAFIAAGALLYNEAILVTAVGSLPIRASRPFVGSRKLGKTHQNVLVFCKGDPAKAAAACGEVTPYFPEEELAQESSSSSSL